MNITCKMFGHNLVSHDGDIAGSLWCARCDHKQPAVKWGKTPYDVGAMTDLSIKDGHTHIVDVMRNSQIIEESGHDDELVKLRGENDRLRHKLALAAGCVTTHTRNWSQSNIDATLYSLLVGWGTALPTVKRQYNWTDSNAAIEYAADESTV
jgi:hypothetical protein